MKGRGPATRAASMALAIFFGGLFLLALSSRMGMVRVTRTMDPGGVFPAGGRAFMADPPRFSPPFLETQPVLPIGDAARDAPPPPESGPALILSQQGRRSALIPARLSEIREKGGGRYLSSDFFFFSTPDGSDPRAPGKLCAVSFPARASLGWTLASGLIFLTAAAFGPRLLEKAAKHAAATSAAAGALLLVLNLAGLAFPMQSPDKGLDLLARLDPADRAFEDFSRARESLARKPGESAEGYALRANGIAHRLFRYAWCAADVDSAGIRVPARENFLLHFFGFFGENFLYYRFYDPKKALQRGVGRCDQMASALAGLLGEAGIPASIALLTHHVVVEAEVTPGARRVLDPTLGVAFPLPLADLEGRPELVEKALRAAWPHAFREPEAAGRGAPLARLLLSTMAAAYGPEGNRVLPPGEAAGFGGAGYGKFERWTYRAKWIVPFLLILPLLARGIGRRRERAAGP